MNRTRKQELVKKIDSVIYDEEILLKEFQKIYNELISDMEFEDMLLDSELSKRFSDVLITKSDYEIVIVYLYILDYYYSQVRYGYNKVKEIKSCEDFLCDWRFNDFREFLLEVVDDDKVENSW